MTEVKELMAGVGGLAAEDSEMVAEVNELVAGVRGLAAEVSG